MSAPTHVLLVEDNPGDALLAQRVLRSAVQDVSVLHVLDGGKALEALRGPQSFGLVLLDLNLPGLHGHEVLRSLRSDGTQTPVVVLTSSARDADVQEAYAAGANAYVTKPVELDCYRDTLTRMAGFWLKAATLP